MPMVDMPLKQLEIYDGTNPIPQDFDDFWNERILEVLNVSLNYEMNHMKFISLRLVNIMRYRLSEYVGVKDMRNI